MSDKRQVGIDYGPAMADYMREIQKILIQQPDCSGYGFHGPEDHPPHGRHTQFSVGIGNTTVNFRELLDR